MQFKDLLFMNFLQIIYSSWLQKAEELKHKAAILEIKVALKWQARVNLASKWPYLRVDITRN